MLYLYDVKVARPLSTSLALREGLGVKTLVSLDSTCYYLENLSAAKKVYQQLMSQFAASDLTALCQTSGLPAVSMERVIYHDVLLQLVELLDLTRRIHQYMSQYPVTFICYIGEKNWKFHALATICKAKGVIFTSKHPLLSRLKPLARSLRDYVQKKVYCLLPADKTIPFYDFLFFIPNARMAKGLLPVISALSGDYKVQAVADSKAELVKNVSSVGLLSFMSDLAPANEDVAHILNHIMWEVDTAKAPANALRLIVSDILRVRFLQVACVHNLLKVSPDAVVVASFVSEPLLEVARACKQKTVVIQTCSTVEYALHLAGDSDYLLASEKDCQRVFNGLQKHGILSICGHANYDTIEPLTEVEIADIRSAYNIQPGEKVVLFVGSYAGAGFVEWESIAERTHMFLHGVKDLSGVKLVLKLHPYEHRRKAYEAMLLDEGITTAVITQIANINHLLQLADAVVMLESTVGQESIMLDKPLLDIPVLSDWYGYHECGAALLARNARDVQQYIEKMLYDSEVQRQLRLGRKRYLESYFPMQDGHVVDRICQHLKNLR